MGQVLDRTALTGLGLTVLKVLLQTELSGTEAAAFQIRHAGKEFPLSGFSFGPIQWDLAKNPGIQPFFRQQLTNSGLFSQPQVDVIMGIVSTVTGQPDALGAYTASINQALSSPAAMDAIVSRADSAIQANVDRVMAVIQSMPDGDRKQQLLNDEAAQVALADYNNWLPISDDGPMATFLRNGVATTDRGERFEWDPGVDNLGNIVAVLNGLFGGSCGSFSSNVVM